VLNLGNESSDVGHIKCLRRPHLAADRRFPTPAIDEPLMLVHLSHRDHYLLKSSRE